MDGGVVIASVDRDRRLNASSIGLRITFQAALTSFADRFDVDTGAVGYAYTPAAARWFRRQDNDWLMHGAESIPASAFELRAFTPVAELRWRRTSGFDEGEGVILTDVDCDTEPGNDALFRIGRHDRSLLLWGKAQNPSCEGWVNLVDRRIGDGLWVPVDGVEKNAQVHLQLADYVTLDIHGNIGVADQRSIRLDVATELGL